MIPVNLFRQYHFCPRIVYFSLLTNIKPIYPKHVRLGEEYHELQEHLEQSRSFKKLKIDYKEKISNQYLESEKHSICGKIDLGFIDSSFVYPVEFKHTESKQVSFSHIMQLFGYGLLLQKKFEKDLKTGFVISSNNLKIKKVEFSQKIRKEFFRTKKTIEKIVEKGNFPDSSADLNKCSQCEYINFCNDRI